MSNENVHQKLAILKEECSSVGLDNLAMILYQGFTDKISNDFELKPHDIRYIEDMWELRKEKLGKSGNSEK